MKTLALFFSLTIVAAAADTAPGVKVWTASELKGYDKTLAAKIGSKPSVGQSLGKLGKYANASISHRESEGGAEVHNTVNDLFVVQQGEATLVTGGETPGAKETEPNEVRGATITGGSKRTVSAGDVIFIPAKTPHQLIVAKGTHFTYFVVKINE